MNLDNRKYVIIAIVLSIAVIFLVRLYYLQVVDDTWKGKAAEMTERKITIYPSRGLIYDRKGKLLVSNKAVYDLMILPRNMQEMDTVEFCQLVNITRAEFDRRYERAVSPPNAPYRPSIFIKQIPPTEYARISEKLFKYPGFYGQPRTLRNYPYPIGPLLLGDIAEVSQREIEQNPFYKPGDYIGKNGIEKTYEEELRGKRGARFVLVDVLNNEKGAFAEGQFDTIAQSGSDLMTTIDAELQYYGERLMQNKKGSIVAIEPSTGEILAMVSSPSFDPNLLVGRNRGENYMRLKEDTLSPLYNRAIMGQYRPGSIFKMIQALVALQTETIYESTRIRCNRNIIGCHGAHSYDDLEHAIIHSCNPYFHEVTKRMIQSGERDNIFSDSRIGLARWKENIESFGLGRALQVDIPGVHEGFVPGVDYYDRVYGERRWAFSTIYSISIGEGELGIVPIQMANLAAIIANRGYFYTPHLVRKIQEEGAKREEYQKKQYTVVDRKHFDVVVDAMERVVSDPSGTARRARIDGIEVCGKTGTVQNEPRPDHSVFMAFAPKDDPQIAIAVYVEYAGFGGTWAAPIASLMMEKYLTDSISNPAKEQRILDAKFLDY
ncbi:penicillin-binding protein 2 [Halocola ammonii]